MTKQMMLLALAVASMAMFALPATASAQEDHIDGITSFTGTINGGSLVTADEPTISFTGGAVIGGSWQAGGTTGGFTTEYTGATAKTIFGNVNCNTKGAATGRIVSGGNLHVITINDRPAIMDTANTIEIVCAGIPNTHVEGIVIATITSPACNVTSTTMTVEFSATGSTQNHLEYTGLRYDLISRTGIGSPATAGLNTVLTLSSSTAGKVTCT